MFSLRIINGFNSLDPVNFFRGKVNGGAKLGIPSLEEEGNVEDGVYVS